jgi:hypothetical protein
VSDNAPIDPQELLRNIAEKTERLRRENQEATDEFSRPNYFRDKLDKGEK